MSRCECDECVYEQVCVTPNLSHPGSLQMPRAADKNVIGPGCQFAWLLSYMLWEKLVPHNSLRLGLGPGICLHCLALEPGASSFKACTQLARLCRRPCEQRAGPGLGHVRGASWTSCLPAGHQGAT